MAEPHPDVRSQGGRDVSRFVPVCRCAFRQASGACTNPAQPQASRSSNVRATTFVARRRSSSTRCSSARLALRFEHRARPGAVDHRRDAGRAVQAHVGVQRRARRRDRLAEHRLRHGVAARAPAARCPAAAAARCASSRRLISTRDARACAAAASAITRAHVGFDLGRVLLGDHAAVELEHHLARHDVGVGAALDAADVEVRVRDAGAPSSVTLA